MPGTGLEGAQTEDDRPKCREQKLGERTVLVKGPVIVVMNDAVKIFTAGR